MPVPLISGALSAFCMDQIVNPIDYGPPSYTPPKMSTLCQPIIPAIKLDRRTYIGVGRHYTTYEYHFFFMIRKRFHKDWDEFYEIPREQIREDYPDWLGQLEVQEALYKQYLEEESVRFPGWVVI